MIKKLEQVQGEVKRPLASNGWRGEKAYDVGIEQECYAIEEGRRRRVNSTPAQASDLETIVTVLEVAALSLTTEPGAPFSLEHLIEEAHILSGEEVDFQEEDTKNVLSKQGFLKRVGKKFV